MRWLTVHILIAISFILGINALPTENIVDYLTKRQYDVDQEHTVDLVFHYTCHVSRRQQRTIRLRVNYSSDEDNVTFNALTENADSADVDQYGWDPIYYSGWVYGAHCVHYTPHTSCDYRYKVYIEGLVFYRKMTLSTSQNVESLVHFRPTVTEDCKYIHQSEGTGEVCPYSDRPTWCIVHNVEVVAVHDGAETAAH